MHSAVMPMSRTPSPTAAATPSKLWTFSKKVLSQPKKLYSKFLDPNLTSTSSNLPSFKENVRWNKDVALTQRAAELYEAFVLPQRIPENEATEDDPEVVVQVKGSPVIGSLLSLHTRPVQQHHSSFLKSGSHSKDKEEKSDAEGSGSFLGLEADKELIEIVWQRKRCIDITDPEIPLEDVRRLVLKNSDSNAQAFDCQNESDQELKAMLTDIFGRMPGYSVFNTYEWEDVVLPEKPHSSGMYRCGINDVGCLLRAKVRFLPSFQRYTHNKKDCSIYIGNKSERLKRQSFSHENNKDIIDMKKSRNLSFSDGVFHMKPSDVELTRTDSATWFYTNARIVQLSENVLFEVSRHLKKGIARFEGLRCSSDMVHSFALRLELSREGRVNSRYREECCFNLQLIKTILTRENAESPSADESLDDNLSDVTDMDVEEKCYDDEKINDIPITGLHESFENCAEIFDYKFPASQIVLYPSLNNDVGVTLVTGKVPLNFSCRCNYERDCLFLTVFAFSKKCLLSIINHSSVLARATAVQTKIYPAIETRDYQLHFCLRELFSYVNGQHISTQNGGSFSSGTSLEDSHTTNTSCDSLTCSVNSGAEKDNDDLAFTNCLYFECGSSYNNMSVLVHSCAVQDVRKCEFRTASPVFDCLAENSEKEIKITATSESDLFHVDSQELKSKYLYVCALLEESQVSHRLVSSKLSFLESERNHFQRQLLQQKKDFEAFLQQQRHNSSLELALLQEKNQAMKENVQGLLHQLQAKDAELESIRNDNAMYFKTLDTKEISLRALQSDLSLARNATVNVQKLLDQAIIERDSKTAEVELYIKDTKNTPENLSKQLVQASKAKIALEDEIIALKSSVSALETENTALKLELKELKPKIVIQEATINNLREELHRSQASLMEVEQKYAHSKKVTCDSESTSALSRYEKLKGNLEEQNKRAAYLQNINDEIREQKKALMLRNADLTQQLFTLTKNHCDHEIEIKRQAENEINDLQAKLNLAKAIQAENVDELSVCEAAIVQYVELCEYYMNQDCNSPIGESNCVKRPKLFDNIIKRHYQKLAYS